MVAKSKKSNKRLIITKRGESLGEKPSSEIRILGAKGEIISFLKVNTFHNHFLEFKRGDYNTISSKQILLFKEIKPIISFLEYSQQDVAEILEVNSSTISRWNKHEKDIPIGRLRSKIIFDIDHLIAKGIRIFGTEENFKSWLNTSNYALGDKKPIELLKNPYEIEVVDNTLEAMSWGSSV